MISTFKAEFRKLRRRPAVWWLGAFILALIVIVYAFSWIEANSPNFHSDAGATAAQLKANLYPANFATMIVSGLAVIGGAFMLVLGALIVGAEYGWGTVKTVYAQRPGRLQVLAGQLGAISVVNAIVVAGLYAIAAVCSFVIANLAGAQVVWPGLLDIVKAMAATWLIFEVWILFGMSLAYLFRQSAMAIGFGLAYMLAIETILVRALRGFNFTWLDTVEKLMVGQNANSLANSFTSGVVRPAQTLVSIDHALVVILCYGAAFILMAALLVRNRDVA
jgi:ABC-type transport system involved in multi-copper enzyme maturation permease subunit